MFQPRRHNPEVDVASVDRQAALQVALVRLGAVVLAVLLVLGVQMFAPGAIRGAERASSDLVWRLIATDEAPERRVVIVDIDERSLGEVGAWPWPRSTIEQISRKLAEAGATAQVFDQVFPEPREGDAALSAAWSALPVTIGQILSLDPAATPHAGQLGGAAAARSGCPAFAPRSHGFVANNPALASAVRSIGHMTPHMEDDGVIRAVPALICHEQRAYPALALAALASLSAQRAGSTAAEGWSWANASDADRAFGGAVWGAFATLRHRDLPGLAIPLDSSGNLLVPYRLKRDAFISVSAADLLSGKADISVLRGAVALVGATAVGLSDTVATPHSSVSSGVEVHAQLLVALLDHRLPYQPASMRSLGWAAGLFSLLLLLIAAQATKGPAVKRLPVLGLGLAAAWAVLAYAGLAHFDLLLGWLTPALLAVTGSVCLATAEHGLTRAQRERFSAHLSAYLPQPVAQQLMRTEPTASIRTAQRDVTVLVADIRNFSSFAAHRQPGETTALLHAFCCLAVDIIESNGGVVENVVGDSVFGIWNAYSDCADHPARAFLAAQQLVRNTRSLLEARPGAEDGDFVPPLALGVGLEAGTAIVGSFGPLRRRAHAALGEPVSVATRLQKMTQEFSFPVLVGPSLARALPTAATELVGEYVLEGLTRHYAVYSPVGWADWAPVGKSWRVPDEASPRGQSASAYRSPVAGLAPPLAPTADA